MLARRAPNLLISFDGRQKNERSWPNTRGQALPLVHSFREAAVTNPSGPLWLCPFLPLFHPPRRLGAKRPGARPATKFFGLTAGRLTLGACWGSLDQRLCGRRAARVIGGPVSRRPFNHRTSGAGRLRRLPGHAPAAAVRRSPRDPRMAVPSPQGLTAVPPGC